ncbi:MAG: PQQ-binding-like beta-propeller repeat protein [Candidatus Bathyarchaeota archaeon]|nr:PQQ-binding-like beta-propeller repeat protein [Candidatus Bathyarchaeota archaeon]
MNLTKNRISKQTLSIFAIVLALSIAIPMTALSTASAHTPAWQITSFAYVTAAPNPIGVGQKMYVYMWVDTPLAGSAAANDIRRHDYTVIITDPDGSNTTQHWDVVQDTTNVQAYSYTPSKVGNYTVTFKYGGQVYTWNTSNTPGLSAANALFENDTFLPAQAVTTFTVQEDPIRDVTSPAALPTEYWTRPINGQNSNWYVISSNWLNGPYIRSGATATGGAGYGRYQKDGSAPETQHIMWTKPIQQGGVVGGSSTTNYGEGFYTGSSYNTRFSNPIVMQGILYYQEPYGNSGTGGDYVAVKLQTGQELWRINASATGVSLVPSFGYLYSYESPNGNQHGVLPNGILIASTTSYSGQGTTWKAYDASNGVLTQMTITNVPSGTIAAGPRGEYLIYTLTNYGTTSNPNWYLAQWNSSKILIPANEGGGQPTTANAVWYTGTSNASLASCYDWNVSLSSLTGTGWSIYRDIAVGNKLMLTQGSMGVGPRAQETGMNVTVVSINPDNVGHILMSKSYAATGKNVTRTIIALNADLDVFVTEDKETLELNGYSLVNGNNLWTSNALVVEWDTLRRVNLWAYDNLYCSGYDGIVYCYDMKTGNLKWTYGNGGEGNSTNSGQDTVYGHYPTFVNVIADGKVYVATTEHSPDQPLYKGSQYRCLNATTGEEIWTLTGMGSGMYVGQTDLVADGYFTYLNIYDMQIYTLGKGASKLTVEAPTAAITQGQSLVIRGSVTDIAAGTTQDEQAARFPNGVPCVSDASMKQWMEYVYMQQNKPTTTTGVEVTLSVVDANGNYRVIGTTTTVDGFFTYNYQPDIPGQYLVYASFAGSNAYYPSSAMTSFAVDQAPATATPQPTQPPSAADLYFIPAIAGLFVLVVVSILLTLLVLKKRP